MISKYGLEYPDGTPEATLDLGAYSFSIVKHLPGRHLYLQSAIAKLWPDPKVYRINPWTERRIQAWCANPFFTMWGPSSSGKSTDIAAILLTHWLSAPDATTCIVCSTTQSALMLRIFGEILRLYQALPEAPGRYYKSQSSILLGDESTKNGIFGRAIEKGSLREALGNLVGTHNRRVCFVIDEMQAIREAAVMVVANLQGGEDFHFVGMGNPESRLDPLGRHSEPLAGWDSVSPSTPEWDTKFGKCLYFDGNLSPAIIDPGGEKKYPYLLKQSDIDLRKKWFGENSPLFWSQSRGFIPPEGLIRALFTESFFSKNHMGDPVIWRSTYETGAALDPAFSSGGDRCVLSPFRYGFDSEDRFVIEFQEPVCIPLQLNPDEPLTYNLVRQVIALCTDLGVPPDRFALDVTGQPTLADLLEHEWGTGLYRVNFAGKPTELPISVENPLPGNKQYTNRVTELWHIMFQFGRFGQIRGLSDEAMKEFSQRLLADRLFPVGIESKQIMKARVGYSPDIADSHVIACALLRERLGVVPGSVKGPQEPLDQGAGYGPGIDGEGHTLRDFDIDSAENNYLTSPG